MGALRLHRYLATLVVMRLAVALCLLIAVYAVIDAAEARSLATGAVDGSLLRYHALRFPAIATHVMPLAAVLGALLALGALRKHGEWEALLGAGVAPGRLILGLSVGPLLAAAVMVPLSLELAPCANAAWSRVASPPADAGVPCGHRWVVLDGGTLARAARAASGWIPTAVVELPGGEHRGRRFAVPADAGIPATGSRVDSALRTIAALDGHDEPPASSWSGLAGQTMPRAQLDSAISAKRRAGLDVTALEAERALRYGLILACALLPVLGLLLAAAAGLGRASALSGLALALGVGYWLLTAVAWNGATAGAWPAAWIFPGVPAAFATGSLAAFAFLRCKG